MTDIRVNNITIKLLALMAVIGFYYDLLSRSEFVRENIFAAG